jgi:hypothetical protein
MYACFLFGSTGVWTQGLTPANKRSNTWATLPAHMHDFLRNCPQGDPLKVWGKQALKGQKSHKDAISGQIHKHWLQLAPTGEFWSASYTCRKGIGLSGSWNQSLVKDHLGGSINAQAPMPPAWQSRLQLPEVAGLCCVSKRSCQCCSQKWKQTKVQVVSPLPTPHTITELLKGIWMEQLLHKSTKKLPFLMRMYLTHVPHEESQIEWIRRHSSLGRFTPVRQEAVNKKQQISAILLNLIIWTPAWQI